jgi:hypothetical protein
MSAVLAPKARTSFEVPFSMDTFITFDDFQVDQKGNPIEMKGDLLPGRKLDLRDIGLGEGRSRPLIRRTPILESLSFPARNDSLRGAHDREKACARQERCDGQDHSDSPLTWICVTATAPPTLRERLVRWFQDPPKAPVFEIKNPTQWKLSRVRQEARGLL